jgi:hypothetical protein
VSRASNPPKPLQRRIQFTRAAFNALHLIGRWPASTRGGSTAVAFKCINFGL